MHESPCILKEIEWAELAEDPATMACQQLLENIDLDEDPPILTTQMHAILLPSCLHVCYRTKRTTLQATKNTSRRMKTGSRKKNEPETPAAFFPARNPFPNASWTSTRSLTPALYRGQSMPIISCHCSRAAFHGDNFMMESTLDSKS